MPNLAQMRQRTLAAVAVAASIGLLGGCSIGDPPGSSSPTTTWGEVHDDVRPLKKHFPVVGTPVSASWVKGSIGQPPSRIELPSPSSTALDAVVELEPAVAAKLHDELADADQSAMPSADPDVAPALRSALPGGPYIVAKNNLGSTYGWSATVYLSRDRPVLVLHAFLPWATGFTE